MSKILTRTAVYVTVIAFSGLVLGTQAWAAKPAPTVSVSVSPQTVASGATAVFTWSSKNATACTGTGIWSGSEALDGSKKTGALTEDASFALTCTGAGGRASESATVSVTSATGTATLSWIPPTINTNGTPVTPLSGYHVYFGNSESALTKSIAISGAKNTSYEITGLTKGTWYFAVAADAADGTESAKSKIGSKVI